LRALGIDPLSFSWPPFGRTGFDSPRLHQFRKPASRREAGFFLRALGIDPLSFRAVCVKYYAHRSSAHCGCGQAGFARARRGSEKKLERGAPNLNRGIPKCGSA
jgi:hypothetical protein